MSVFGRMYPYGNTWTELVCDNYSEKNKQEWEWLIGKIFKKYNWCTLKFAGYEKWGSYGVKENANEIEREWGERERE